MVTLVLSDVPASSKDIFCWFVVQHHIHQQYYDWCSQLYLVGSVVGHSPHSNLSRFDKIDISDHSFDEMGILLFCMQSTLHPSSAQGLFSSTRQTVSLLQYMSALTFFDCSQDWPLSLVATLGFSPVLPGQTDSVLGILQSFCSKLVTSAELLHSPCMQLNPAHGPSGYADCAVCSVVTIACYSLDVFHWMSTVVEESGTRSVCEVSAI